MGRQKSKSELTHGWLAFSPIRVESLIDHVGRRLQVLVNCGIALPLVDEPVAHTKLKAKLFHITIIGIEVLVVQHSWRHVNGIALVPVVALTADLGITVAFERIEISFRMGVAMAFGMRQVD